MSPGEAIAQRRGLVTIVLLAVLTGIEYVAAVEIDSTPVVVTLLSIAAVAKAAVIIWVFMHLPKLWRGEGEHA
jgi:hypothetical protein